MPDHLITALDNRFEEECWRVSTNSEFCLAESKSFQRGFKDDLPSAKALLHTELDLCRTNETEK